MNVNQGLEKRPILPPGWRWRKLVEVCEFLDSQRVPVNESDRTKRIAGKPVSALYPYYGANGQVGWIDDYLFDEPLILLAEDGEFFGSHERPIAYSISGKTWVNNHAHVLRPKSGVEQKRIEAVLSEQMASAERLRNDIEKQLHEINSLPAALLKRAFNGEL